jgi:hypothetical protein
MMIQISKKHIKHVKSCAERHNPVDIIYDSRGIVVQGKTTVHTKMLNEGYNFERKA